MDEIDHMQEREERLAKLTAAARGYVHEMESADECIECGLLIPSERQLAIKGVQTCVDCAEVLELSGRNVK